jgi:hypothetical protein
MSPEKGWPREGRIQMRHITLRYGNEPPVLKDISLHIKPQEKVLKPRIPLEPTINPYQSITGNLERATGKCPILSYLFNQFIYIRAANLSQIC